MENLRPILNRILHFIVLYIVTPIQRFYKSHKETVKLIVGILAIAWLLIAIIKEVKRPKQTETYKATPVMFVNKSEVEKLRQFASVQTQIDSLELLKVKIATELLPTDQGDLQKELDLIFNN